MKQLNNKDLFEEFVDNTESPVLVLFHADWCVPCQRFKPQFAKSSLVNKGYIHVMANIDEVGPDVLARYGIMSVPTVGMFEEGRMVKTVHSRTAEGIFTEIS